MSSPDISRRDFLRIVGAAIGLRAADSILTANVATAASDQHEDSAKARLEKGVTVDGITLSGIPGSVEASRVDVARTPFKNNLDLVPHVFAEPGGLLVGPDFANPEGSPWGGNPGGWKTMYEAGGSIHPFSSVTQEIFRWNPPAFQNCPEGGFTLFTSAQINLEIRDAVIGLPYKGPDHIYIVAARGLYPDSEKNTPKRNTTIKVTGYVPGHIQALMYESRLETNLAFVSLEQALQFVATAHTTGTNGGAKGESVVTLLGYDTNTGAIEWARHWTDERNLVKAYQGARFGWQRIYSNYR